MQITLKQPHDFYYGYRPLKAGDTITIQVTSFEGNEDIRVTKSSVETYPGYGIRITQYELDQLKGIK